jgi:hypothetical protein
MPGHDRFGLDHGQGQGPWVKPVIETGLPDFPGRNCNGLALPSSDVVKPPFCLFTEPDTVFFFTTSLKCSTVSALLLVMISRARPSLHGLGQATGAEIGQILSRVCFLFSSPGTSSAQLTIYRLIGNQQDG